MFTNIQQLGYELDQLEQVASQSNNVLLQQDVARFVSKVADQVQLAFTDVQDILGKVAFVKDSLSSDEVSALQQQLSSTYAREKFKVLLRICDSLDVLANDYKIQLEPKLDKLMGNSHNSQLFWLLEKHEGAFIHTIKFSLREIIDSLETYKKTQDISDSRAMARQALKDLQDGLFLVSRASRRAMGSLPNGVNILMNADTIADDVLRKSPWFSGSFYLGSMVILMTGLTIIASNVKPLVFPLVVAFSYVGVTIIGAFQLKNDGKLADNDFLSLIKLSMTRVLLPLTRNAREKR